MWEVRHGVRGGAWDVAGHKTAVRAVVRAGEVAGAAGVRALAGGEGLVDAGVGGTVLHRRINRRVVRPEVTGLLLRGLKRQDWPCKAVLGSRGALGLNPQHALGLGRCACPARALCAGDGGCNPQCQGWGNGLAM